jgi:hypothetical protein
MAMRVDFHFDAPEVPIALPAFWTPETCYTYAFLPFPTVALASLIK